MGMASDFINRNHLAHRGWLVKTAPLPKKNGAVLETRLLFLI